MAKSLGAVLHNYRNLTKEDRQRFDICWEQVKTAEGSTVVADTSVHSSSRVPAKYGIRQDTASENLTDVVNSDFIRQLTEEQAAAYYHEFYYQGFGLNLIEDDGIRTVLFDSLVLEWTPVLRHFETLLMTHDDSSRISPQEAQEIEQLNKELGQGEIEAMLLVYRKTRLAQLKATSGGVAPQRAWGRRLQNLARRYSSNDAIKVAELINQSVRKEVANAQGRNAKATVSRT
jgi:hypothetical protein